MLNVKSFGLTFGILWSIALFILTWWIILFGSSQETITVYNTLGDFYFGYSVTAAGSFIGLIWGFFDGLICGSIFAMLYNYLAGKFDAPKG